MGNTVYSFPGSRLRDAMQQACCLLEASFTHSAITFTLVQLVQHRQCLPMHAFEVQQLSSSTYLSAAICWLVGVLVCVCLFVCLSDCLFVEEKQSRPRQLAETENQTAVALATAPTFHQRWVSVALKHRALGMLPFAEQGERSLVLLGNTLGAQFRSAHPPHRQHHFDFAFFQEKVLLVGRVCRLRFCLAQPLHCLPDLGQPSSVAVVSLSVFPPLHPCLICEHFR